MQNITRQQWIAEAAYYLAEARNFAPGLALDDWLAAEHNYVKMEVAYYLSIAEEDGGITILGLQQLANALGIAHPETIAQKIELIQSIQNADHHRPCFRSDRDCHGEDCEWRAECKKMIASWCR